MHLWYSYTENFTQDVFCLNESDFEANLIPSYLDIGSNNLDCRLLCHLYYQLKLQKPIRIRFHDQCLGNLGSLEENPLNKGMIDFVKTNFTFYMKRFNQNMCEKLQYYSCDYSEDNLKHLSKFDLVKPRGLRNISTPTARLISVTTRSTSSRTSTRYRNSSVYQLKEKKWNSSFLKSGSETNIFFKRFFTTFLIFSLLIQNNFF